MSCEIARRMSETNDPALAQHQRSCPSCIVGAHARYYEAPPTLERKIRARLRREGRHDRRNEQPDAGHLHGHGGFDAVHPVHRVEVS